MPEQSTNYQNHAEKCLSSLWYLNNKQPPAPPIGEQAAFFAAVRELRDTELFEFIREKPLRNSFHAVRRAGTGKRGLKRKLDKALILDALEL